MSELFNNVEVETIETETVSNDNLPSKQVTVICSKIKDSNDYDAALIMANDVAKFVSKADANRLGKALDKLKDRLKKENEAKVEVAEIMAAWGVRRKFVTAFHVKYGTSQEFSEQFLDRLSPEFIVNNSKKLGI